MGQKKPKGYLSSCILVALYKDTHGIGYDWLLMEVKSWMPVSSKTLCYNTQLLRRLFGAWGRKRIKLGSLEQWERAARGLRVPKQLQGTCLWIDSWDVRKVGKLSAKGSDPDWSKKRDNLRQVTFHTPYPEPKRNKKGQIRSKKAYTPYQEAREIQCSNQYPTCMC